MDATTEQSTGLPVSILGIGRVEPSGLETPIDVLPFLRDRKMAKLMSKQDKLGLIAAGLAVRDAGLTEAELDGCGVYFGMGTLPFEQAPLEVLLRNSVDASNTFSMERSSVDAFRALNPLLTFQCLPNMPVFHVSYNLGIHGAYFVTYPGTGAWFRALGRAAEDLAQGRIRYALLGAVADQRNVLTRHHLKRTGIDAEPMDVACVWVLGKPESRKEHGRIEKLETQYRPQDPWAPCKPAPFEPLPGYAGIAEPSLRISRAPDGTREEHRYTTDDGVIARIAFRKGPAR